MGFMTPVEVSLWVRNTARRLGTVALTEIEERRRGHPRCRLAPLDVQPFDVRAVDLGDLREPVAEAADGHGEDPVAGRQRVDRCGLQAARPRAGEDQDVVGGGAEVRSHAADDPVEQRRELGAAVVDHLLRPRLADGRWQGGGAGDAQVRLEAGHGSRVSGWGWDEGQVTAIRWSHTAGGDAADRVARA